MIIGRPLSYNQTENQALNFTIQMNYTIISLQEVMSEKTRLTPQLAD